MKIALSGYGRMGKELDRLATTSGHEVLFRLNSEEDWQEAGNELARADVVIDFSWPDSVVANIRRSFDLDLPVVTGTTGWYEHLPKVKGWCENESRALFVAANFSIGVNLMMHLSEKLSILLNRFNQYEISIEEVHHILKLDAPSGTAIRLAEAVLANLGRKKSWSAGAGADPSVLRVSSVREGEIPGIHLLRAESGADILEIIHRAKNLEGFATGALLAAEWLQGRRGFFCMKDLLELTD